MSHRALLMVGLVELATAAASPASAPYAIIARYEIGGNEAGYDYLKVDAEKRRVFVAHGNRIEVIDADSGKKVGEIPDTHGSHGIELIPELGKGYVTAGLDRAVTVFDRDSLAVRTVIKGTGVKPDALRYDPQTRRLFVVNGGDTGDVSVIDPSSDTIVATIKVGGQKLEQIEFDGRGHAFINDEGKNVIHVVDTHALQQTATWSLAPCEEPTGMAIDKTHHRIFSACGNEKLAVVDSDTGRLVASPKIGSDPDGALFDGKSQRIYTSNREGSLSVLREVAPDKYETVQTVKTEQGARTLAMDEKSGKIFLAAARTGPAPAGGGRAPIIPESFVVLVVAGAEQSAPNR